MVKARLSVARFAESDVVCQGWLLNKNIVNGMILPSPTVVDSDIPNTYSSVHESLNYNLQIIPTHKVQRTNSA